MLITNGPLYQWDLDRTIEIALISGLKVDEIHAHNKTTEYALNLELWAENNKIYAKIPNSFLQSDNNIDIYAITSNEFGRHTTTHTTLSVNPRVKPIDYVYTEEEIEQFSRLENRIKELELKVEDLESIISSMITPSEVIE